MNNFLETLKKLGPARLAVMGGVLVGLLIFFVYLSLRVSTPSMELLYEDLSTIDSSAIASTLSAKGIRYNLSPDGSSVMIPSDEIARARMLLAEEGLPNGASLGYEIFDEQSGFGTTNFVQNINQVRALEGELARTISSLEAIRNARVHIVLPQRALFSRETTEARASVMINVRPGNKIEKAQANSIQFLIASAIPNMKASSVSIVDQNGTLLARGDEDEDSVYDNRTMDMRRNIESRLRQNIEEIIGQIVGFGKVRATVSADLNFDRITTNEELYDPETQVVRSSQITEESSLERDTSSNEVGVGQNIPTAEENLLGGETGPSAESNRIEEVTNYEISRTIRNMVSEVGEVRKLSVAVLIDGTYQTTTNDEGEEVRAYQPRSQEELDQISALVRSAVGIDETRGDTLEVANMQFADIIDDSPFEEDTILGFKTKELTEIAQLLIVTIAVLLIVLLVLRPMVGRILEMQDTREEDELEKELLTAQAAAPALTGPSGERLEGNKDGDDQDESMVNMMSVEGKVKASSLKKVEDIVSAYPNETVSVLRSWMSQES